MGILPLSPTVCVLQISALLPRADRLYKPVFYLLSICDDKCLRCCVNSPHFATLPDFSRLSVPWDSRPGSWPVVRAWRLRSRPVGSFTRPTDAMEEAFFQ